jgi:hypothetical protein
MARVVQQNLMGFRLWQEIWALLLQAFQYVYIIHHFQLAVGATGVSGRKVATRGHPTLNECSASIGSDSSNSRSQHTNAKALKGLLELCQKKDISHGYVVTKSLDDFGVMKNPPDIKTKIMHIPAPLLCYWMGESELRQTYGF